MQRQRHDKKAAIHYKEMLSHCASMMVLRNKDNLPGMVKACKWVQIFLVKFQIQLCFLPRTVCNRTWKISQRGSRLLEQLAVWLSRRPKQFRGLFNRLQVQQAAPTPAPPPPVQSPVNTASTPPGDPEAMFCDQCGARRRPGKRFCNSCGARLD